MSNDFQKNPRLAAVLRAWWSGLDDDRAARAELRRAHNITAVSLTPAYQRAYRRLQSAGWDVEGTSPLNDRLAAVIGLLAHVKSDGEKSPPEAMSKDSGGGDRPPVSPLRFQPAHHRRRQALRLFAKQRLQSLAHVAGRYSLQVKPRQRRRYARRSPHIGRHQLRVKLDPASRPVSNLRHLDRHRPCCRQNVSFRLVAIAHDHPLAAGRCHMRVK